MNSMRLRTMAALTAATITVGIGSAALATNYARQHKQPRLGGLRTPSTTPVPRSAARDQTAESLETARAERLASLKTALDQAIHHFKAGHQQAALDELARAQDIVASLQKAARRPVEVQFVNARCPIMSSPINTGSVTEELTRTHGEQEVAFCCAGCPTAWDRLSAADKEAKLKSVAESEGTPEVLEMHGPPIPTSHGCSGACGT